MATEREDEVDCESDPEDTKRSLVMRRRRAASDDEEDAEGVGVERGGREGEISDVKGEKMHSRTTRIQSDKSDEGGADDYDVGEEDEEDELDGEEGDDRGGYDDEQEEVVDDAAVSDRGVDHILVANKRDINEVEERDDRRGAMGMVGEWAQDQVEEEELEGEKEENEPFAVPTAGAFYMHDDRFGNILGGRNRYNQFGFGLFMV